jgi:hypothetical protein
LKKGIEKAKKIVSNDLDNLGVNDDIAMVNAVDKPSSSKKVAVVEEMIDVKS